MEEDTEYTKLPVEDRCVHKVNIILMKPNLIPIKS